MHSATHSKVFLFLFLGISSPVLSLGLSDAQSIGNAIEEIRNSDFLAAERIILQINNYRDVIPQIARTIYNGSEENTDLILGFSRASSKVGISFLCMKELRSEMKKFGHRNPYKLMDIIRNLESEVLNHYIYYDNEAKPIIDEVMVENQNAAKEILKAFMIANNFKNNTDVRKLLSDIFEFDEQSSDIVMEGLVNDTISSVPAVRIADEIMDGSWKIPQIASGLTFLFWKLVQRNDKNNQGVLRIAEHLSTVMSMKNYENTSKKRKYLVNMVIEQLPLCARNLNFAKEICIRNRGRGEYIFASQTQFYNSSKRRAVFACDTNQLTDDGAWKVMRIDSKTYFKNLVQKMEYLYASPYEKYDAGKRHIQTWSKDKGSLPNSSTWRLELNGDYCYIKNDYFNEYLYASDTIHSDHRRFVFSAKLEMSNKANADFQWQIENCV